jgi:hypothetical protein
MLRCLYIVTASWGTLYADPGGSNRAPTPTRPPPHQKKCHACQLDTLQPMSRTAAGSLRSERARASFPCVVFLFFCILCLPPVHSVWKLKKLYFLNGVSKLNFICVTVFLTINSSTKDPTWIYLEKNYLHIYYGIS